jgi:hypothetical protein
MIVTSPDFLRALTEHNNERGAHYKQCSLFLPEEVSQLGDGNGKLAIVNEGERRLTHPVPEIPWALTCSHCD